MSVVRRRRVGIWGTVAVALVTAATAGGRAAVAGESGDEVRVRLELADGGSAEGVLRAITADAIGIEAAAGRRDVPLAEVRRLVRLEPPPPVRGRVRVELVDGTGIDGDDFTWGGDTAAVSRPPALIELPGGRVRRVEFRAADDRGGAAPAWLAAVPDVPTEDLAVVAKGDAHEVVECAITAPPRRAW